MYYFIVNPNARSGKGKDIWKELRSELALHHVPYKAYITEYVGHAVKLSSELSLLGTPEEPLNLVAVGGDGTLQEVLTGIQNLNNVFFGYIPIGSGNDFCRSMQLPRDPSQALQVILKKDRIMRMDIPRVTAGTTDKRFGISAGIGFDAAVCQEVAVSPVKKVLNKIGLGKLAYIAIALKQLLFMTPSNLTIEMDGNRKYTYEKVYFAAVMNQKYEGGGFKFCPQASPCDGILDVIVAEGLPKLVVLSALPTAFWGMHTLFKGIHTFRCKSIKLHSAVPLAVHYDGESGGIQREISVCFENDSLKVILPAR